MRVLIISKACIVGQYQSKLETLARHHDVSLTAVVPPYWQDERGRLEFERGYTRGYTLRIEPLTLNGHFHLHFYPTLPGIIRADQLDIVHIDEEPYNLATFLAFRAARQAGAKTVFFTWQNLLRRYPPPFSAFESFVIKHANYAIAGNQGAADVLSAKGYRGPIRVIPQFGVNLDRFAPKPEGPTHNGLFRIGFVGRFVEEKGAHILLQAVARLAGEWETSLIGSGPEQVRLESLAGELGIRPRVRFLPWTLSKNMPAIYHKIDTLVVPSITRPNWKEQFGRVLIEAMACRVPVIGSNCGEIPNVVGEAGLVFPENDVNALAAHLESLRCDVGLRSQLGERGRQRVVNHYTQERVAEATYNVYREMMPEKASKT